MDTMTLVAQATGDEPAGGAAIGEALGATAGAAVATALIAVLIAGHRSGRIDWLARAAALTERLTGLPGWAALPSTLLGVVAAHGRARHVLGHLPAHRQRPRRRAARQPGPLPDPDRALRRPARRRADRRAVARAAEPHGRRGRRRLVGAGRRRPDRRLRRLRAVGLPARRHLAPAVRPGRDALGPDAPDADRRRLAGDARGDGAACPRRSGTLGRDPERDHPRVAFAAAARPAGRAASSSRCPPSRASSTSACRSSARCCTRS